MSMLPRKVLREMIDDGNHGNLAKILKKYISQSMKKKLH